VERLALRLEEGLNRDIRRNVVRERLSAQRHDDPQEHQSDPNKPAVCRCETTHDYVAIVFQFLTRCSAVRHAKAWMV
jgi:hypothetical protein